MFDPYHRWLAIPPGQRPPTYYQLLGIDPDEQDAEVIKEAALRQTSHVRTYQTGPYAEHCATLLNEIGQARAILLHADKRREYDASLAQHKPAPPPLPPAQEVAESLPERVEEESARSPVLPVVSAPTAREEVVEELVAQQGWESTWPIVVAYLVILLVGAALAFRAGLAEVAPVGPGSAAEVGDEQP